MSDEGAEVVTIGELLARIRASYVETFACRLADASRGGGERVIPEVAVCQANGEIALVGSLGLPRRVDACVFADDAPARTLRFDSERLRSFESLSLVWGDGLKVDLHPFTWDACALRFASPGRADLGPLLAWFRRWFDEGDERGLTNEFPGGVVHSISGPAEEGEAWLVVVDLGSARLKAFEELLDAVAAVGAARVVVGHPPPA